MPLADVPHLDLSDEFHVPILYTVARQRRSSLGCHCPIDLLDLAQIEAVDPSNQRRRVVVFEIGNEEAQSGRDAGTERDQGQRDSNLSGQAVRVDWTGAAESDQNEPTRIVAAL